MNSLSIIIYFLGMITNFGEIIKIVLGIASTVAFITGIGYLISKLVFIVNVHVDKLTAEGAEAFINFFWSPLKWSIGFIIIATILMVVLPSRQTFILIAASEIGQRVVTSDKISQILDPSIELLQTYIKEELTSIKNNVDKKVEGVSK